MYGFLPEDQSIERIAVVAERARDEAVVGGIVHRAEKHAIQFEQPGFLVQLVLVLGPFGNFDDDGKGLLDRIMVNVT